MTEKLTTYDHANALADDEEIAFFMADALKTDDAAYIAKALGVVARAKGLLKPSLQRIKMVDIIGIYHQDEGKSMDTARIFQSGRSQAIRLPKEYRFAGTEVKVKHVGNAVLLMPSDQPWGILATALSMFEPGFTLERSQPDEQVRETLLP